MVPERYQNTAYLQAKRASTGVEAQDEDQQAAFKRTRLITFASMWVGYVLAALLKGIEDFYFFHLREVCTC